PKSALSQSGAGQPGEIWAAIHEEAYQLYPSRNIPPSFAMKYKDGDGIDDKGIPFAQREGYAGHLVFALSTRIPIKWFKYEGGQNIMINEGIKCGDYVNVQVQVKAHGAAGQGKSGMYLNPMAAQLIGYGKEIINTPSADSIFGTDAPKVPQGASSTPIAPAGGFPMVSPTGVSVTQGPAMPAFVQPQVAPQGPAQGAPQGYATPQQPVAAPHYGVLPQAVQPQVAPQGPVQGAPSFNPNEPMPTF
ncbi:hypothetical protein RZS08_07265, partial [Arthrospira platensis SPKY1]|nr:hypothetical protein [Arthrospira platensis SPKY1]